MTEFLEWIQKFVDSMVMKVGMPIQPQCSTPLTFCSKAGPPFSGQRRSSALLALLHFFLTPTLIAPDLTKSHMR